MVCSLHSVTMGSRDRANVSLIIIIKTRLDLLGIQNVKVGSKATITELLHGIGSTVYIIVTLIVM